MAVRAQDDPQYRMEIGAGVGVMTYEGDFNGNVLSDMQPAGFLVGRYNFDYAENPYSFNHTLVDMNLVFEYNFWPYGTGRDYRGAQRLVPYILGGLGATYVKGNEKNVFTANVPLGIGAKYKVNERLNLGLAWTFHFSLSDELDGVKDPYWVKSSGIFKNTDCYSTIAVSVTYSFSAKCKTCNKEE